MPVVDDIANLEALDRLTWEAIAARADRVSGRSVEIPQRIDGARDDAESRFSERFRVLDHLQRALALTAQGPLAQIGFRFAEVMPQLRWSQNPNYTEANSSRSFLDGYAYAGFVGPDAPLLCAAPRGGHAAPSRRCCRYAPRAGSICSERCWPRPGSRP